MTPADLIREVPVDEREAAHIFTGATHEIVEDFRGDFPTLDNGNNDIRTAISGYLDAEVYDRLDLDSEYSCLYVYGAPGDLQLFLNALQALKGGGFGQPMPTPIEALLDVLREEIEAGTDPEYGFRGNPQTYRRITDAARAYVKVVDA